MGERPNGIHRVSQADRKALGEECRRLRDEHNLSLTMIARRKGVSVPSVMKWIKNVEPK